MADTFVPDLYNPQSLNRYAYCLNNPVRYVDPSGHRENSWGGHATDDAGDGSTNSGYAGGDSNSDSGGNSASDSWSAWDGTGSWDGHDSLGWDSNLNDNDSNYQPIGYDWEAQYNGLENPDRAIVDAGGINGTGWENKKHDNKWSRKNNAKLPQIDVYNEVTFWQDDEKLMDNLNMLGNFWSRDQDWANNPCDEALGRLNKDINCNAIFGPKRKTGTSILWSF